MKLSTVQRGSEDISGEERGQCRPQSGAKQQGEKSCCSNELNPCPTIKSRKTRPTLSFVTLRRRTQSVNRLEEPSTSLRRERIVRRTLRLIKPDGGDRQDRDQLTNEHSQGQRQTFQGYFLLHQPTPEHYRTVKIGIRRPQVHSSKSRSNYTREDGYCNMAKSLILRLSARSQGYVHIESNGCLLLQKRKNHDSDRPK